MAKNIILALYILFLPFQLRAPQLPIINTMNLFLIVLLLIFISKKTASKIKMRFHLPLFIFLVVWLGAFIHTLVDPRGLWIYQVSVEFKRLITVVLGYFVFSKCLNSKKDIHFLFLVFLFSLVLVGLVTYRNGVLAGEHFADFKRSSGPFGEGWKAADIAGGFLAIFIPFLLSNVFFAKKMFFQIISFIALVISILGILTTYSRGSILAFGVSSFIVILFTLRHLKKVPKFSRALIFLIILAGIFSWRYFVPKTIMNRIEGTVVSTDLDESSKLDESSQKRMTIWKANLELFNSNPLFGIGFMQSKNMLGVDSHNAFLLILVEMGIFGLAAFIWLLLAVFRESLLLLKTEFITIGIGFVGSLIGFTLVNMFYANFFRDTVVGTFWVALGLLGASRNNA